MATYAYALKFLVRQHGGAAIKFCYLDERKTVTQVRDPEASLFDQRWQAELKAAEFGLRHGSFTVEPFKKTFPGT